MSKRGMSAYIPNGIAGRSIPQMGRLAADVCSNMACPNIRTDAGVGGHRLSMIPSDHPERPAIDGFTPALHLAALQR
jgi:hypothetical protein